MFDSLNVKDMSLRRKRKYRKEAACGIQENTVNVKANISLNDVLRVVKSWGSRKKTPQENIQFNSFHNRFQP